MYYSNYRTCPSGTVPYMVRPGDTFYRIAMQFNTTVAALVAANPTVNPNYLVVGQLICVPRHQAHPPCPEGNYYTVRSGDTFYSIAASFNLSVDELRRANPSVDPNRLYVGQVICIPVPPVDLPTPVCPPGTRPYTVVRGDTFFSLAQRFNTTVDAIRRANPGINPEALFIGQVICIPTTPTPPPPTTCPTGTRPYTIQAGDTFFSLAQRFNTTVDAIRRANPGVDPDRLQIGQVICIPTTPTPPPTTCPTGTRPYTIQAGDTFFGLAQRFNTTVDAIRRANPGVDPDRLQIGQVICIPTTPTPPPTTCPTGTRAYTIQSGDTYFRLAQRFNTTVDAIRRANPGVDPDRLQIGQVICIPTTPTPPSCPVDSVAYTIVAGDSLYVLARRYNTTVDAIIRLNPNIDPQNLQIGQVICIPAQREED